MVPLVHTVDDLRQAVGAARGQGKTIGLVPTMGALHEGHARLIEQAGGECGFRIVSIYVNPTQFGPTEDFTRYPRTLDDDRARCTKAGADLIFTPSDRVMYPRGHDSTVVEVPDLSQVLEGASRPGHFRGVATVVLKLFQIVQPDVAYFGLKDFQQQAVIRRMVEDLNVPVAIRTVPTVREADGLAMSSRNRYLSPEERSAATVLYRALEAARTRVAEGLRDADSVRQILRETVESEEKARLDYAEVADAETLTPLADLAAGRKAVALLAVRVGTTRLIDNTLLPD